MRNELSPIWLVIPCVVACGGGDGNTQPEGGATASVGSSTSFIDGGISATGSPDATPSTMGGGTSTGTSTGNVPLTSMGFPISEHCTPLTFDGMGAPACNDTTEGIEAALVSGIDASSGVDLGVNWKELPQPMTAGSPYAISTELTLFDDLDTWQFEVWGVASSCATGGEQAELLGTTPIGRGEGVYCVGMTPSQAYTRAVGVPAAQLRGRIRLPRPWLLPRRELPGAVARDWIGCRKSRR